MLKKLLQILFVSMLVMPGGQLHAVQEKATEKQISELKKSIAELTRTLGRIRDEKQSVQGALRKTDKMIGTIAAEIIVLNKQLQGAESRLSELEQQRKPLLNSLRQQAVGLEEQLRQQYKAGAQPRLQLLLTQRDPEQLSRMMHYFDRINQHLTQKLKHFQNDLNLLSQAEQDIRSAQKDIFDRRDLMQARAVDLEEARRERQSVLKNLEKELQKGGQHLQSMQQDQKRLSALLQQIRSSVDKIALGRDDKAFRELKGRLPWPVKGKVNRVFGSVRDGITFEGIQVAARTGREVKAVHHGRVVFSDWLRGYGLLTIVDHGGGYMSLYGQNESLMTEVGEWVSAGDQIATVGTSGGNTRSGLYFAVRYNGKSSDPIKWLARR